MPNVVRFEQKVTAEEARQHSVVALLKELITEAGDLIRSEADVIKLEMQEATRAMIIDSLKVAVYSGIALLGVLSLTAFLIIALGDLLSPEVTNVTGFWLSALIIGLLFTAVGGYMAYANAKQIGKDIGMPKTKVELRTDREFLKAEAEKIKEASKR